MIFLSLLSFQSAVVVAATNLQLNRVLRLFLFFEAKSKCGLAPILNGLASILHGLALITEGLSPSVDILTQLRKNGLA